VRVVCVRWLDSRQSDGWSFRSKMGELEIPVITSYGVLIDENEQAVRIGPHYGPEKDGDPQYCGTMTIPRCAILGLREIETLPPE
jgi:hypothetical protein